MRANLETAVGNCLTLGVGNYLAPPLGNYLALEGFGLGNCLVADTCPVFQLKRVNCGHGASAHRARWVSRPRPPLACGSPEALPAVRGDRHLTAQARMKWSSAARQVHRSASGAGQAGSECE